MDFFFYNLLYYLTPEEKIAIRQLLQKSKHRSKFRVVPRIPIRWDFKRRVIVLRKRFRVLSPVLPILIYSLSGEKPKNNNRTPELEISNYLFFYLNYFLFI